MHKLNIQPCEKCGDTEHSINSTYKQTDTMSGAIITFTGMFATCKTCGWLWQITPLDKSEELDKRIDGAITGG